MRFPILLSLLLVAGLHHATLLGQAPNTRSNAGVLSPGDTVRITVWRSPELSGDFAVGPDGTIMHPLYRGVKIAGVPMATAEANLARFLSSYQGNPQFVIEPLVRVAVSGDVTRPQVFATRPETSVAEAVARAGGVNQFGRWDRVRLLRTETDGSQNQLYFNLRDPADPLARGPVRSGDLIVVDRKRSFLKDIMLPAIGVVGSIASLALLIQRNTR